MNVVAPGPVATDMIAALPEDRQADLTSAVPLGRFGDSRGDRRGGERSSPPTPPGTSPAPSSPSMAASGWGIRFSATQFRQLERKEREQWPNDEKFDRFKKCVVDVLSVEPEKVTMEAKFGDDLDADSLDLVELVMALEEEFDVEVPEEELDGIQTVGEAYQLITSK